MQPEDIIQAKEWNQLSEEERQTVAPLATTEGEFNVLKKMLLLVAEDAASVPPVGPQVQQRLRAGLRSPKSQSRRLVWYAAAASVLILLSAGYLLLLPEKGKEALVVRTKNPVESVVPDSLQKTVAPAPSPVAQTAAVTEPKAKRKKAASKREQNSTAVAQPVQTSVALNDHIALLNLVTEAY